MQKPLPLVSVMVQDPHVEGSGSLSHFVSNAAHPNDPKCRSGYSHSQPVNSKILCVWRHGNVAACVEIQVERVQISHKWRPGGNKRFITITAVGLWSTPYKTPLLILTNLYKGLDGYQFLHPSLKLV